MQPTMMPGDVVTVICDQRRVKAGEIAVYANGQRLLAHRVVAAGRFGILTKPDSVEHFDAPVQWNQVIGVVDRAINSAGVCRDLTYLPEGTQPLLPGPSANTLLSFVLVAGGRGVYVGSGLSHLVGWASGRLICGHQVSIVQASDVGAAERQFDCLIYHIARNSQDWVQGVAAACQLLRPGGLVLIVGSRNVMNDAVRTFLPLRINSPFIASILVGVPNIARSYLHLNRVVYYNKEVLILAALDDAWSVSAVTR